MRSAAGRAVLALMLPAALFAVLHLRTLDYEFVWTDDAEYRHGSVIRPPGEIASTFHEPLHRVEGVATRALAQPYYRPLQVVLASPLDARFAREPRTFRSVSLLLGAVSTSLFAGLAWRIHGSPRAGLLSGCVFAAHPACFEAYAWVGGQSAALVGLFILTSVLCALGAIAGQTAGARLRWGAGSLAALLLGLASKENAAVVPALVLALAIGMAARDGASRSWRGMLRRAGPLLALQGAIVLTYLAWWRPRVLGSALTGALPVGGSHATQLATSLAHRPRALGWLFAPIHSSTSDAVPVVTSFADPGVALGFGLAIGSFALWLWLLRRRQTGAAFALAWIWIAFLPTSGIVPLLHLRSERNLFLAVFGAALLWPSAGPLLLRLGVPRVAAAALATLLVLGTAQRSWARSPAWQSTTALFERDVGTDPRHREGRFNLALESFARGRSPEALPHIEILLAQRSEADKWSAYLRDEPLFELACRVKRDLGRDAEVLRLLDEEVGGTAKLFLQLGFFACVAPVIARAGRHAEAGRVHGGLFGVSHGEARTRHAIAAAHNHARAGEIGQARAWLGRVPAALARRPDVAAVSRLIERSGSAASAYHGRPMTSPYRDAYHLSLTNPQAFWARAAQDVEWVRRPRVILNDSDPNHPSWFPGGMLNTCYNAVDLHVLAGRGEQAALVYDSPVTGTVRSWTYAELQDEVARLAGALVALGVERGDRVLLYMPMVPEAVFGMLACARIGAIHSVVFGGFAAGELAQRIQHAAPKVILSASCGIEPGRVIAYKPMLDDAVARVANKPSYCVVLQRPEQAAELRAPRDVDWGELVRGATPTGCVPVDAKHPLYVLYTSGTTGLPKGVVRDNGGHAVALKWSLRNVYAAEPGDVFWAASDIGWVVGHSYIVYAPLLLGCTTVLYEGKPVGTPDAGAFWRVVEQHRVNVLFTAPTALRAVKREDPQAKLLADHDIGSLRTLFLAGERADPDTVAWCERALRVPVIDHWWQTETGWPIAANCLGLEPLPVKHGSPTVPVPGYDVRILDDEGSPLPTGETGHVTIKLPLPPGCLRTLWENDAGYEATYLSRFPGYYQTADAGHVDEDGYLWIMSRTDDIINVAGHRLSTGAMEEVLAAHPDVAECAVTGVADELKGQVPLGFVVLNAGSERDAASIERELVALVREKIGPVAAFKQACVVPRLPKTRSGKVLRGTMRKIADAEPYRTPPTIDDPSILDEIRQALESKGYA